MKKQIQLNQDSSRRNFFKKLAIGSLSGVIAGTAMSADDEKKEAPIILQDPNVCRGLNTCNDKGKGDHECAGQSNCATAEAHSCKGMNTCKGQGGCGSNPGQNECKSQGGCAVPLSDKSWKKARSAFEKAATKADLKVGPAPAKAA